MKTFLNTLGLSVEVFVLSGLFFWAYLETLQVLSYPFSKEGKALVSGIWKRERWG